MKKLITLVAIIATLASCSKNEVNKETPASPIDFLTLNDKVTRAANDADASYSVYSQYTAATAGVTTWYIVDQEISSLDVIQGDKSYLWPSTALDFYAFAPSTKTNYTVAAVAPTAVPAKGTLSVTYTVPTPTADEDFTVATVLSQTSTTNTTTPGSVPFVFKHMLSKVNINAKLGETFAADYVLTVNGKTTLSVQSSVGTVDVMNATPALVGTASVATYETSVTSSILTPSTIVPYLIMPYSTEGYVVTIAGVTVTKDNVTYVDTDLTYTFVANDTKLAAFAAGVQNNLNFEVNLNEITFTSSVVDWVNTAPETGLD